MNFIRCTVESRDGRLGVPLHDGGGTFFVPAPPSVAGLAGQVGKEVILGIRPEQITDKDPYAGANPHSIEQAARVEVVQPTGPDTLVLIRLNGTPVTCRVHPGANPRAGQPMGLTFDLSKLVFFDPVNEKRIR